MTYATIHTLFLRQDGGSVYMSKVSAMHVSLTWSTCCRGKTNFFEKRVGDYQKSGVMAGLTNSNQHAIAFDEDF